MIQSARRLIGSLLVLFVLALAMPATAQIPGIDLSGGSSEEPAAESVDVQAALDQLIVVLQDEAAREALITELQASEAAAAGEEPIAAEPDMAISDEIRSFGGQVADFTGGIIDGAVASVVGVAEQLAALPQAFSGLSATDLNFVGWLVANLAILVLVTYGGLWLMALVTERVRRRLRATVRHEGFLTKVVAVIATLAIDVVRALVPWAVGYGVALALLGEPGQVSYQHRLYLNGFIVLELALAVLRTVLAPTKPEARMVTLATPQAKAVMTWSRVIASVLVYGQLVLLPLMSRSVSPAAGRVAAVLGLALVLLLIAFAVLRMRLFVASRLVRFIGIARARRGLRTMVRYWHVPVLVYLFVLFMVALSRPVDGFYGILWANAQVGIAIIVGVLFVNVITRMIGAGITLPPGLKAKVPLLEERLNAFVPKALWVLRALVIVLVIAWCLHLVGAFNFLAFLESEIGIRLSGAAVTVGLILIVGFVLWLVLNSWVDYRINPDSPLGVSARERTLLVLLRNAVTIALIVIIMMFVLSEIGINIAPLLASAGVIGLAIGFGAQKLVQDIITGVFIQLEGAIDVGDVVQIGGISGVVERLTVRSAGLRDVEGNYHLIPFSSVDIVTNFMRGFSFALIDMGVSYREDANYVREAMHDAFTELKENPDHAANIIADFEWFGVNAFGPSEVVLRGRIKCKPGTQWGVKRAYNGIIKRIFDERGIEIPFPHQTVYFGEDKLGKAPPIRILRETREQATQGQGTAPAAVVQSSDGITPPARTVPSRTPIPRPVVPAEPPPPAEFQALPEEDDETRETRPGTHMPDVDEGPQDDRQ